MTLRILFANLLLGLIFMTVVWLIARRRGRLDTVDTAWGLGFIVLAVSSVLQHPTARGWLIVALVTIWGGRLSLDLAKRSRGRKEDPRYAALSSRWGSAFWPRAYFSIFIIQGLLTWLISWPIVYASGVTVYTGLLLTVTGVLLWLAGFTFEVIGDHQLRDFLRQSNHGKVMSSGLWRYSRHPNYFGEITQWTGIAVIACGAGWGWVGFLGPAVLTYVIIFISGVRMTEQRHANDPAWKEYQRRTSMLIPLRPKP